jgi:3-methyladenine DNA glycosylase Mpg
MGLGRALDGCSLLDTKNLFLLARERRVRITCTARIGVGYAGKWADAPYRFYDAASAHVSKPPRKSIGSGPNPGSHTVI